MNAYNFGRENAYVFIHNDKKIRLKLAKPGESQSAKKIRVLFKPLVRKISYFDL